MKQSCICLRTISFTIAVGCLLTATQAMGSSHSTSPPPMGKKIYYCHEGLEQFMPGDYYACRAKYYFQRGHYRLGLADLEESARWANKNAQYTLGLLYSNGDVPGIPQNRPLGLAWLALSIERKNQPGYQQAYEQAYLRSSPKEIAEANRLYKQLRPEYGDQVAGARATHRFVREMWPFELASHEGGINYVSDFTDYPEPATMVVQALYQRASKDFDGLRGSVTVGALQSLGGAPTPSESTAAH
jgi:hypothetical protein